jgi:hypothetical protein
MGHPLPAGQAEKVIVVRRTVTTTEYIKSSDYRSPHGYQMTDSEIAEYEVMMPDEDKFEAVMGAVAGAHSRNIDQHVKVDVIFLDDNALRELRGR